MNLISPGVLIHFCNIHFMHWSSLLESLDFNKNTIRYRIINATALFILSMSLYIDPSRFDGFFVFDWFFHLCISRNCLMYIVPYSSVSLVAFGDGNQLSKPWFWLSPKYTLYTSGFGFCFQPLILPFWFLISYEILLGTWILLCQNSLLQSHAWVSPALLFNHEPLHSNLILNPTHTTIKQCMNKSLWKYDFYWILNKAVCYNRIQNTILLKPVRFQWQLFTSTFLT